MKTYRGKYDGLYFVVELPDEASEQEIKSAVNRIISDDSEMLSACKKGFAELEKEKEFWQSQAEVYLKMLQNSNEQWRNMYTLVEVLRKK